VLDFSDLWWGSSECRAGFAGNNVQSQGERQDRSVEKGKKSKGSLDSHSNLVYLAGRASPQREHHNSRVPVQSGVFEGIDRS
jgi:hypothetical protein